MFREFREFLEKFNVIPAAVGLVLALAVVPVMDAVVNVIMSLVGKAGGLDTDFSKWEPSNVPLGALINAIIAFILIAFVVFLIIKALARAGAKTELAATPDQVLLTEIRDTLRGGR